MKCETCRDLGYIYAYQDNNIPFISCIPCPDCKVNNIKEQRVKRYNLVLPEEVFEQIRIVAEKEHSTFLEVIRRFIKLGLFVYKTQENGDHLLVDDGLEYRSVWFFI